MDLKGAVLVVEVGGAELRPLSPLLLQILAPPRALYVITRSLTSSWRPFGPLDFVLRALQALSPVRQARLRSGPVKIGHFLKMGHICDFFWDFSFNFLVQIFSVHQRIYDTTLGSRDIAM